ncbi:MAG: T9SS type A sorting domain-containing protein, partial [Saprospiraceae bacterium]
WYQGPNPIQGANNDTLVVTQPGNYWLTATPEECPNFVAVFDSQFIHVIWSTEPGCSVGVSDPVADFGVTALPNPVAETLAVVAEPNDMIRLTLINAAGLVVRENVFHQRINLSVVDLPSGVYSLLLQTEHQGTAIKRVVVQH